MLKKIIRRLAQLPGKRANEKLVLFIARFTGVNLLKLALNERGILKHTNFRVSGEDFVIKVVAGNVISPEDCLIDIGANKGDYTRELKARFPRNRIISIEANPETYNSLVLVNKDSYNVAVAAKGGKSKFYTSRTNRTSGQASLSKESIPQSEEAFEIEVEALRLEELIKQQAIKNIGLLKVDVEGHELEVLVSGKEYLKDIKLIQFEFNEKHVYTRTFLKDFYDLLSQTHDIFRLDSTKLIDIRIYSTMNEIFRFQNLVAIKRSLNEDYSLYL